MREAAAYIYLRAAAVFQTLYALLTAAAAVQCAAEAIAILEMITDAHEILCIIS